MVQDTESQDWIAWIQDTLILHNQETLEELCLTYWCWELHIFRNMGAVPLRLNEFSGLMFLKISAILVFGEQDLFCGDVPEEYASQWIADESKRIHAEMIGALPPNLQRLHITECMEILKRESPDSILARVIRDAPLEGLRELNLMEAYPKNDSDDSNEEILIPSVAWEQATRIANACVRRDFDFELALYRQDYYDNWLTERGWGMEDEVRCNCEGEDPSVRTA